MSKKYESIALANTTASINRAFDYLNNNVIENDKIALLLGKIISALEKGIRPPEEFILLAINKAMETTKSDTLAGQGKNDMLLQALKLIEAQRRLPTQDYSYKKTLTSVYFEIFSESRRRHDHNRDNKIWGMITQILSKLGHEEIYRTERKKQKKLDKIKPQFKEAEEL